MDGDYRRIKALTPGAQRCRWDKSLRWSACSPHEKYLKMQQVAFCFLTLAETLYMCARMHEWIHTPSHRAIYLCALSAFVKSIWKGDEITLTFDSDTILVSSHCFALYIYFI